MIARGGVLALALVAGCVPAVSSLRAPVRAAALERGGRPMSDGELAAALGQLDRATAVRIALTHNPRVEAALAELGVTAGEVAGLRDVFAVHGDVTAHFFTHWPPTVEVEIVDDLLAAVLAGPRRRAGDATIAAVQARVTATLLAIAARAERAHVAAAAAAAQLAQVRTSYDAAALAADLDGRIRAAGGTTDLALARAQAAREDARLMLAEAELAVELSRAEVDAALGLTGDETRWVLAGGLPELPTAAPALDDLEATTASASLELRALAADDTAAANQARIASVRSWLPELGVGVAIASEHDVGLSAGPVLRLGLPLTTAGRGRALAARATLSRLDHTRAAVATELRARARAVRIEALATYDQARHLRDVIIPLRQRVIDELVLQYNAMNASPFELLTARRELVTSELALIAAHHRFAATMIAVDTLRRGASAPAPIATMATPAMTAPAADGH